SVGAIVETDQGPMRVTHMGNARGVNLHSGKPGKVPSEGMLLTIHKSHVLTIKPRVMVLHPETFQAAPVANAILPKLVEGEKVKVVLTMHAVYIV
ncbi:MAG TPA: hypothetical protein VJK52_00110, partial [Candidatus Nanoarchaeia archaeon]|nr:hypothetical protein [Candidatus Nanoarchaeia archaeon]